VLCWARARIGNRERLIWVGISMVGSPICLVLHAEVVEIAGSDYKFQRVVMNPSLEVAVHVQLYLQAGVL